MGLSRVSISLGVLNATSNLLLWMATTLCAVVSERIYRRMSSFDCARDGYTRATDATEIMLISWIFPEQRRRRHMPAWWVFVLLLLNIALLPLEILFESGIDEFKKCSPRFFNSTGVCAKPWSGRSLHGCSATAVLTDRFEWLDEEWDIVLEGQPKMPKSAQVQLLSQLRGTGHNFLVKKCQVTHSNCSSNETCGDMTFAKVEHIIEATNGSFILEGTARHGGLSQEAGLYVGHIWYVKGSAPAGEQGSPDRRVIAVEGVETIFSKKDAQKIVDMLGDHHSASLAHGARHSSGQHGAGHSSGQHAAGHSASHNGANHGEEYRAGHKRHAKFQVPLDPSRTRRYEISCMTDGIPAQDLARSISVYRTATLDAPAVPFSNLSSTLANLPIITASQVTKAVYAFKLADVNEFCNGIVEEYAVCGGFRLEFVLPFFCLVCFIVLTWLIVFLTLPQPDASVPVDASSWRHQAQQAMRQGTVNSIASHAASMLKYEGDEEGSLNFSDRNECLNLSFDDEKTVMSVQLETLATLPRGESLQDEHLVQSVQLSNLVGP